MSVDDSTTDLLRSIRRRVDETSTDLGREALGADHVDGAGGWLLDCLSDQGESIQKFTNVG